MSLLSALPPGSALHRALDPEGWEWRTQEELQAAIVELLDQGNRMYLRAHSKRGTPVPQPVKVPRPHRAKEPRSQSSPDEVKAVLENIEVEKESSGT